MIDIKALESSQELQSKKTYLETYRENLRMRSFSSDDLDKLLVVNQTRKDLLSHLESSKAKRNQMSPLISEKKKKGEDVSDILSELAKLRDDDKEKEQVLKTIEAEVRLLSLSLPNMNDPSVPFGKSEEDNKIVKEFMPPTEFNFKAKDHVELGEDLGLLDFEMSGKISGARFSVLRGSLAQLERALIQFFLSTHVNKNSYEEVSCPFLVGSSALEGTSQLPKFAEDLFKIEDKDLFLIPTAEVPLTNLYSQSVLSEDQLPIRFAAHTPCFRSEAGSYGRDTKGLIRQHQFHKVEMVQFVRPEESDQCHEQLTLHAEGLLEDLGLPYQRALLCSGDISFGAQKCYDLNVWLPSSGTYREISSCSNFGDFQARRAMIRYRPKGEKAKPRFVHTLNGSGLAIGRTLLAILENYQNEDGSIRVPDVLVNYMGGLKTITKRM